MRRNIPLALAFLALLLFSSPASASVESARKKLMEIAAMEELAPLMSWALTEKSSKFELPRDISDVFTCAACSAAIGALVKGYEAEEFTLDDMNDAIKGICKQFQILSDAGCEGIIDNYGPPLEYVYFTEGVPANTFCSITLGEGNCGPLSNLEPWEIAVDPNYPEVEDPQLPESGQPIQKVLHISDFHVDLTYTVGSKVDCEDFMCCTNSSGMAVEGQDSADYWGEYVCDIPPWTMKHMFEHIRNNHQDIDMILLTGDYPAHDLYFQSKRFNLGGAATVVGMVKEFFPGIPVFPTIGNHEAFPENMFPTDEVPEEFSVTWLYDGLTELYAEWLPDEAEDSFRDGGYYSMQISPGFRFIAVNSMNGYTLNFWMGYHYQDANNHLSWLHEELFLAERAGEKVWLLSHLPPGNTDCMGTWGKEFTRIVERFENTIVNQFYGHTHRDEFKVFYNTVTGDGSRPISSGFVTPSVTPHTNVNLAYRIYTADGDYEGSTRRVLDYDTYVGDLSSAGDETEPPVFSLLYNAKEDLGLESLLPSDYDGLVRRLRDDDDLWQRYYSYYVSASPTRGPPTDQDRYDILCEAVRTDSEDHSKCREILEGDQDSTGVPTSSSPSSSPSTQQTTVPTSSEPSTAPTTEEVEENDNDGSSTASSSLYLIVGATACLLGPCLLGKRVVPRCCSLVLHL